MTTHNDDDDLQALWQLPQEVNVQKLIGQVAKQRKKALRVLILDIVANILGLVLIVYLDKLGFFGTHNWVIPVFFILTVLYLWWVITWRRGLWASAGDSAIELLRRKRKHTVLDIKVARTFGWGIPLGAICGLALGIHTDHDVTFNISETVRIALQISVLVVLIFGTAWGLLKERSAKRELVKIDALIEKLSEQDNED